MMKPAFHQFAHAVHILVRLSFNPVVEAEVITSGCQRLRGVIVARLPHEAVSSVYVEWCTSYTAAVAHSAVMHARPDRLRQAAQSAMHDKKDDLLWPSAAAARGSSVLAVGRVPKSPAGWWLMQALAIRLRLLPPYTLCINDIHTIHLSTVLFVCV